MVLDLTNHPNSLKWKAYRLDYANPSSLSSTNINPQIFVKRLQLYLGDVCNYVSEWAFACTNYLNIVMTTIMASFISSGTSVIPTLWDWH